MVGTPIGREQRFSKDRPCPICGGHDRLPHGKGVRCFGFLSSDGLYAHCTREDLAGAIKPDRDGLSYAHRLYGLCRCGMTHGDPLPPNLAIIGSKAKRGRKEIARYSYQDESGAELYHVRRYEPKAFYPYLPGAETPALGDVRRVPYRLPDLLAADPDVMIFVVEGEKDADALADLGLVATTSQGGAGQARQWLDADFTAAFAGRPVAILPDNDHDGRRFATTAAEGLRATARAVKIVALPDLPPKGDVSDWLAAGGTPDDLIALFADAEPAPAARTLPTLDADERHLPRIVPLAWDALSAANDPPRLFSFGGLLTRLRRDANDLPQTEPLTEDRLRYELARAANWEAARKGGALLTSPPTIVVRDMLADPKPPLPPLDAIVAAPSFATDGSVQTEPGYHPASRAYYAPAAGFAVPAVPDEPTGRDLDRARDLIADELLGDFPFTGDAERAHAIGLLILPFVRALIAGPTPLHLIEKPTAGTGATLLADMLLYPATGMELAALTEGKDEDEWRKRITARLRMAPVAVLIDNLRQRLETISLASALTATYWEDRLLGTSDTARFPVRCAWIATGNNPSLSSEIARRTIRIRLDARADRPWLRTNFRYPDLRDWARGKRGELARAALTLGRAWLADGKPIAPDAPKLGMYESWSRVIGGILGTAGLPGFLANLAEFYDRTDTEGSAIRQFIAAWWGTFSVRPAGVAELFRLVAGDAIDLDLGDRSERSQRIRLGLLLGDLRDRHYRLPDGAMVRVVGTGALHRAQQWQLVPAADNGESGEHVNV